MVADKKPFLLSIYSIAKHLLLGIILILTITQCTNYRADIESKGNFPDLANLFEFASNKADSGNIPSAMYFLDSAIASRKLNVREKFKVLSFKTEVYFYFKDSANAIIWADSMLSLVNKNGKEKYKEEYTTANYAKGDILFFKKRYDEAYKYYFIARHLGETSLDLCALSEYSYRIGMILYQQSRFMEAAGSFRDAFNESEKCSINFVSFFRRQELLSNTGLSFLKAGKHDSAHFYSDRALQYLKKYDRKFKNKEYFNDIARGVIYGNKGQIFKEQGNYSKAEYFLRRSIDINTKKGFDNKNAQLCQLQLAEVYFLNHNIDSMATLLAQARQNLDTIENRQAEIVWNRLMWKYNEMRDYPAAAFKYLKQFTFLHDSATRVEYRLHAYDVSQQIKLLEDQYEINSLHKENQVKDLYLVIFLITTAFGIAIFLFFLYILRNTKKNYVILKSLNRQIEEQKVELEQALFKLEEKNREKDRILQGVAHDLRTPVASISMLTDLILAENDENAKAHLLKLVRSSSDNSLALISEILEAAGTESKKELLRERVEANTLLTEVVTTLRFKAAEKQQTINLELLTEKQEVLITKEKIQRVITNLISNAIKFSPPDSEVNVKCIQMENVVQFIIEDNGIGIPEKLKSKVFDMFTEAKRPGTSGERPYGLGLSICKRIVEAHGGSIWFESEEGKGTTFVVELNYIKQ